MPIFPNWALTLFKKKILDSWSDENHSKMMEKWQRHYPHMEKEISWNIIKKELPQGKVLLTQIWAKLTAYLTQILEKKQVAAIL